MKTRTILVPALVLFLLATLTGCTQSMTRSYSSESLAKMIEPVADSKLAPRKTPLTLPVSVAIVTVPGNQVPARHVPNTTLRLAAEKLRLQLLENPKYVNTVTVAEQNEFINSISLEKIRSLYGADIVIILSFQQDQRSNQSGPAGLMDATVAGIFLVPGTQITTSSVIDGKVIHVPSSAVIFMASGMDEHSMHSTSFARETSLNEESIRGILAATKDFGNTLTKKISNFDHYDLSQAVPVSLLAAGQSAPANDYWKRVETYKSTGGGAFGLVALLISAATCAAAGWRRK